MRNPHLLPSKSPSRPAEIVDARVDRTYPDRWLVDVTTAFDRRWFASCVVLSPYLNPENGAGMSFTPPEGTRGLLFIPSDGSPPAFLPGLANMRPPVAPTEDAKKTLTLEEEAIKAKSPSNNPRFDNNRAPQADGDQVWRGHDGQGVELLMGGIARIYSGALCQTVWSTRGGRRTEVCRSSLSIWEGGVCVQRTRTLKGVPTYEESRVFRVSSSDEHGSIRQRSGRSLLGEPDGFNALSAAAKAGLDLDDGVMELTVSPQKFSTGDGEVVDDGARKQNVFRALLTLGGGLLLRLAQALVIKLKKKLVLQSEEDVWIESEGTLYLSGKKGVVIASENSVKTTTPLTQFGGGSKGVVRQGDMVVFALPPGTEFAGLLDGATFTGIIKTISPLISATIVTGGSPNVKVD